MHTIRCLTLATIAAVFAGCALPGAPSGAAPAEYLLQADFNGSASAATDAPVLMIARPRASAGYDSVRMIYREGTNQLRAFARNRWAGTPAGMLEPLLVDALEATGAFRAVVSAGSGLGGDLRLDAEVLRLQQDFTRSPSTVRFGLRATLVDAGTGRVVLARRFETEEPAAGNDPESGAAAANRAVEQVLTELADAVAESVRARE